MNTPEDFVNRLQLWRKRQGFSQAEAAQVLGVTRSYLNQIEKGREPGRAFFDNFLRLESEHVLRPSEHSESIVAEKVTTYAERKAVKEIAFATRLRADAMMLREMAERLDAEAKEIEKLHGFA